jgi:prolycopene isomerase
MAYDVVVVGAGVGGLTVAALLAARGINVCVFERNSQVGGCARRVEYSNFDFEPGMGLYPCWGAGEIYDQIFEQLPVPTPEAQSIDSDYVVRLPDATDVYLRKDSAAFSEELRKSFPECSAEAIEFYKVIQRRPTLETSVIEYAKNTSDRFLRFVDAQLRAFVQTPIEHCTLRAAVDALNLPRQPLYTIAGGASTLCESMSEAVKLAGGTERVNSPVLRLAYDENGNAIGVDLLSGERVFATRSIISNMTIWDTYGKLIGLNRTPPEVKKSLTAIGSSGAYLIYASLEQAASERLPAERFLVCSSTAGETLETSDITFATSPVIGENGKRAVTLKANCPVEDWFAFQSSEEDYEAWDQEALAEVWGRVHQAVPELGSDIEVIETANPRTFYDETRRKLGMVMGMEQTPESQVLADCRTSLRNVFMISDTVTNGFGQAAVTQTALSLAKEIIESFN